MLSEVKATHISPSQIQVSCDCPKGYHLFGNNKDQHTWRVEYRGMAGHGCTKYKDCKIHIDQSTQKVQKFPAKKFRKK